MPQKALPSQGHPWPQANRTSDDTTFDGQSRMCVASLPIALYARTSTRQQDPEVQLVPLRRYAQHRDVDAVEFVDQTSGRKGSRPALNKLMRASL